MIRKATAFDIPFAAKIYDEIHEKEAQKAVTIGWVKDVYPTAKTAEDALKRGDLFVFEEDKRVVATAIINQTQVDVYRDGDWLYDAPNEKIMVLHTLTVSPKEGKRGVGRAFVRYYEEYAAKNGCTVLRMDTNEKNAVARAFYKKLGFREAGIVPCEFNGIPGVQLVLLEKLVEK